MIYLDTHVIVWMYAGKIDNFTKQTKRLINSNEVFISPVVRLELQYLFEIGRITVEAKKILSGNTEHLSNCQPHATPSFPWSKPPKCKDLAIMGSPGLYIYNSGGMI